MAEKEKGWRRKRGGEGGRRRKKGKEGKGVEKETGKGRGGNGKGRWPGWHEVGGRNRIAHRAYAEHKTPPSPPLRSKRKRPMAGAARGWRTTQDAHRADAKRKTRISTPTPYPSLPRDEVGGRNRMRIGPMQNIKRGIPLPPPPTLRSPMGGAGERNRRPMQHKKRVKNQAPNFNPQKRTGSAPLALNIKKTALPLVFSLSSTTRPLLLSQAPCSCLKPLALVLSLCSTPHPSLLSSTTRPLLLS